jgi:hypothetical protein
MSDPYFADDPNLTIYTDAGPITRHNDMGDQLRAYPRKIEEEEYEDEHV